MACLKKFYMVYNIEGQEGCLPHQSVSIHSLFIFHVWGGTSHAYKPASLPKDRL